MISADPRQHLIRGTPDRRCWSCAAFVLDEHLAQPLGDCTRVEWILPGHGRQMVHADDVCAKYQEALGGSIGEREDRAVRAGLG